MKTLFLTLTGLSVLAQGVATVAPESPLTPSIYERMGLVGCLAVAVVWLVRDSLSLRKELKEQREEHELELKMEREQMRQFGERVAAIAERALERLK